MIRRLIWFVSGIVAGVSGVLFAGRRVKKTVGSLAPARVVGKAADATRDKARTIGDAWREGREAMRAREAELRARRDGRLESLASSVDPVKPGDEVLVDGRRVEPGRVIVLRQVENDKRRR